MSKNDAARRQFLKFGGSGAAGMALGSLAVAATAVPGPPSSIQFDVRTFGAAGDGKTLDTSAIDKAIAAASAAGGGTVTFSAGQYLCYSIHLKSNVVLFLGAGATIVAAESPAAGPAQATMLPNQVLGTSIRISATATGGTA